jgi:hypothetical protein
MSALRRWRSLASLRLTQAKDNDDQQHAVQQGQAERHPDGCAHHRRRRDAQSRPRAPAQASTNHRGQPIQHPSRTRRRQRRGFSTARREWRSTTRCSPTWRSLASRGENLARAPPGRWRTQRTLSTPGCGRRPRRQDDSGGANARQKLWCAPARLHRLSVM